MESIKTNNLMPGFISDTVLSVSEIWFSAANFTKGEHYLVSASSGAGKSSFVSFILGERADYSGEIYFDNHEIKTLKIPDWQNVRKTQLSCVFQGLRLFSDLTVLENIQLKNKITDHKTEEEVEYLIRKAGLENKINEKAGRLSFGQQQRVATIRALCQPFDFILLDEPFSHLDEENIRNMSELITNEIEQKKAAMILCSLGYEYPFNYHKKYII